MADYEKLKITALLEEIKKHNSFFQNPLQNQKYTGYIIEFDLMENFYKKLSFEELKNLSSIQFSRLKENLDFNKINNYIISKKFESVKDLESELKKNQKYYIILDSLWKKICKNDSRNENGIKFYFQDNKMYLEFKNNEVISFYINNGIIEESNMIQVMIKRNNKRPQSCIKKIINKKYTLKLAIDTDRQNMISIDKQYKSEYSCLKCKCDIEFKSIKCDKEKKEELITFNCTGKCGTQMISIKDFNEKCFKNTYLNEKCIYCGKIQINEYIKNNNFIYCINCKKIYCEECKRKNNNDFCPHNKYIYLYEIRKKCFVHGEQICAFCYNDKKSLCKICLDNSIPNVHSNHNKVYIDQSIFSREEYKLFGDILEYIKHLNIKEQKENGELILNDNNQLTCSIQKQIKEIDEREKSSYNDFILRKEKKETELKEEFHSQLKNIIIDIKKELSSSIQNLEKEKIEISTLNNFFNNLQKMKNEYLEKITTIQKNYKEEIQHNDNLSNAEIEALKTGYDKMRKKLKDTMVQEHNGRNENKGSLIFGENNGIRDMASLFLTCYNFNKTNYYMAKNFYNLISFFYRNKGIYENVIKKKINEFENKKDLLTLIEKKKYITFDNFISNTVRKDFYQPTYIGLKNIKSFPFMNPILQCFTQNEKFVSYFKYSQNFKSIFEKNNQIKLSNSFKYLIENLWPTNDNYTNNKNFHKNENEIYFSPYDIRDSLINKKNLFDPNNENNENSPADNKKNNLLDPNCRISPKDLIIFIIINLHKELNRISNNVNDNTIQQIDDRNRVTMMNNYMNNFRKENMSIISDLFYSMREIVIRCTNCRTSRYKFQTFFYLDFQLNEVLKLKKTLFNNFNCKQSINVENKIRDEDLMDDQNRCYTQVGSHEFISELDIVNIFDCFTYDRNPKFQMMYCDTCKKYCQFCYNSKLTFTPEILIIFISRFEIINKRMKFEFYEYLNIQQYIDIKNFGFSYKLNGVVASLDKRGEDKHFIAFCRSPIDQKWYKYDDTKVSLVVKSEDEIFKTNPSILFYEKC